MKPRIVVLAHNIRSLWNVGSFFRTCDAFNVEHLYLTGYTGTPPRKEISKTALEAQTWVPWTHELDPLSVIAHLRKDDFAIVALERTQNSVDIASLRVPPKLCLILGHEVTGVAEELLRESDHVVHIPMLGKKESLNVSVAAGIALYALRR